jgi:hypothetical protein
MRSGKTSLVALGLSLLSSCPLRSPALAIRGYWRRHNYGSQSFGASSILLFKAAGTAMYASKIPPAVVYAPSRTLLFPDADQRQG